jgi:signal transduction histidine kinase/ligand-binding sensor domain-containing protein
MPQIVMFRLRKLVLVIASLAALPSYCQTEDLFSDATRHVWHVQDGLVDQVVQAIVQTPDRFLWIGTTKGLIRFDGRNFAPYSGAGAAALSHGVTSLLVTRDHTLYIGTEGGGLLHWHSGAMDEIGSASGLGNSIVRALLEDRAGSLWVGTDRGCYRGTNGRFVEVEPAESYSNMGVASLIEDSHGAIWIGGSRLLRIANGHIDEFVLPAQIASMRIKALLQDRRGGVWVGSVSGLFRQTPNGSFEKVAGVTGTVRTLGQLSSGALWVGTVGEGIFVQKDAGFAQLKAPEVLPSNTVLSQTTDVEGNLWIGTQAGLQRFSRTGIHLAQLPHGLDSDSGTLMRDPDGTLWVCSSHLFRMIDGKLAQYRFRAFPDIGIRTMFRESSGALWLGTAGRGAYRIAPGGKIEHYTSEIGTNYIRGFLEARDHSVWIQTDGGISHYRDGHVDNYHELPTAPHRIVLSLAEGGDGRIWMGTLRGLMIFRGDEYVDPGVSDELSQEAIWALHLDEDGALWIGTGAGLYLFRNNRLYHFGDVLGGPSRAVYQIMGRGDLLWISGPTRAARYSRAALLAVSGNAQAAIPPHDLFLVTGELPAAEFYGGMQPAGLLDPDGSAWLPSSVGPIHLVASDRPTRIAMPLAIEHILIDGQPHDGAATVDLQPNTKTIEIDYAPILLGSQAGLTFRQQLEGFGNWSLPTHAHSAVYTSLPAGRYVFHVQALSSDSASPIAEATIVVVQRAVFYQRSWFWMLCLSASLAAGFGFMRLRVHQIKMRLRAVSSERNRLAREMHDTLLQGCIGISTLLEACASPGSTENSRSHLLDCARSQVAELIGQTRDAMWNLRGHEYEHCDFGLCVEELMDNHVRAAGIEARYQYAGDPLSVEYRIAYEILMSIREALLNAVAHSACTQIDLKLACSESELAVVIADNGIGFSLDKEPAQTNGHYGMCGMRERIHNIGGSIGIETAPGQGTRIHIEVPRTALGHPPNRDLEI